MHMDTESESQCSAAIEEETWDWPCVLEGRGSVVTLGAIFRYYGLKNSLHLGLQ